MRSRLTHPFLRLVAVLFLSFSLGALAQAPATPSPAGALRQGIRVSGWWKIDIRNPDGAVVKHVEFENALTASGQSTLVNLLTANVQGGGLYIALYGPDQSSAPCKPSGSTGSTTCYFLPPTSPYAATCLISFCTPTLNTASGNTSITLSGYMPAFKDGSIAAVSTIAYLCPVSQSLATCQASPSGGVTTSTLTLQTLPSPIMVTAGQVMQVTVILSFS